MSCCVSLCERNLTYPAIDLELLVEHRLLRGHCLSPRCRRGEGASRTSQSVRPQGGGAGDEGLHGERSERRVSVWRERGVGACMRTCSAAAHACPSPHQSEPARLPTPTPNPDIGLHAGLGLPSCCPRFLRAGLRRVRDESRVNNATALSLQIRVGANYYLCWTYRHYSSSLVQVILQAQHQPRSQLEASYEHGTQH